MPTFLSSREAKEYLVTKIIEQADRDGVPLSDTERQMLYWSETAWTPIPDLARLNEAFEQECETNAYEAKIGSLARDAKHYADESNERTAWNDAVRTLKTEDHYLLVLLRAEAPSPGRHSFWIDRIKLIATALFILAVTLAAIFFTAKK